MRAGNNQPNRQIESTHLNEPRRHAVNQLAIGFIIVLWGSLLTLKQVGIIERNVSTWPFVLTAFGLLLVAGGVYRLSRSRRA